MERRFCSSGAKPGQWAKLPSRAKNSALIYLTCEPQQEQNLFLDLEDAGDGLPDAVAGLSGEKGGEREAPAGGWGLEGAFGFDFRRGVSRRRNQEGVIRERRRGGGY